VAIVPAAAEKSPMLTANITTPIGKAMMRKISSLGTPAQSRQ
jgi:hypothetical protein